MLSFYIPRISKQYSEEDIVNAFANLGIGLVSRVDFAPTVPIPPGQRETIQSINNTFHKAFVHLEYLHDTQFGWTIHSNVVVADNSYRVYPNAKEYWILMNNKVAVPATNLNIHQIAENHRILEQTVTEQAQQIEQLKAMVEMLMKK
jgi:hypothetical protein